MATTSTSNDAQELAIRKDEYVAFDALSLRSFIRGRLNESGLLTDQNFEGSNLTAVTNIIAYSFHTLMFYLNQTSTETMFTEAQLYENMNRIVKLINYNPVGAQTPTLSFNLSATNQLGTGTYTIPRYSFIRVGGIAYSFNTDITFTKSTTSEEYIPTVGDEYLLYQGNYIEYPLYTARGEPNEVMFLVPGNNIIVDHFNIDVYVKNVVTNKWVKWTRTESLYLEDSTALKYEIRINGNKNYEIKFGDDINGTQLTQGDTVAVYYLQSAGTDGEVGANVLLDQPLNLYTTAQFDVISKDVISPDLTLINDVDILQLQFDNSNISTVFTDIENVNSIRANAPAFFKTQYRLVTTSDYDAFVKASFANIINDVKTVSNNTYVNTHLRYLYNIGLTNPGSDYRVLYNQLAFADASNFNNVYIYALPKASKLLNNNYVSYLTPAQKQLIISTVNDKKTLTSEIIVMDPVYKAVTTGLGVGAITLDDIAASRLVITLFRNTKTPASVIKDRVRAIFATYFNPANITLGFTVNIPDITGQLLAIDGVKAVSTRNGAEEVTGVSFIVFNPSYPQNDITSTTKTFTVEEFQTVYLNDINDIINRTVIELEVSQDASIVNF